jgi:hypothetical protein
MDATLSWQSEMEVNSSTYIRRVPDVVDQTLLNELEEKHSILGEYCPKPTLEILREGRDSHFIVERALRPHECGGCRALRVEVKSHKETISELRSEVKSHKETISELRSEVKSHKETISELKKDNVKHERTIVRLERTIVRLERMFVESEFLVVAGEVISRLLSDVLFPRLCKTQDPLMEGLNCWRDVGKVLRVSREWHYRGDRAEVERSAGLQDLVYKVVKDEFGMTKKMWDVIEELKGDRNRTYHRRGDLVGVANELCAMLETVEIKEAEKLALQKVIEVIKMG